VSSALPTTCAYGCACPPVDRYELRPEGHEAAAAALWDRLEAIAPFAVDAQDTTGVTLDRDAAIVLDVQNDRMGDVEAARLSFRVLVDRSVVDRHAALAPEVVASLPVESRVEGDVAPMDVVLRTPGFIDEDPDFGSAQLRCSSDDPGLPTYDPCDSRSCGDTCTVCDPADPDCFETSVVKMCQPDGSCAPSVPICEGDVADCRSLGCGTGNECQNCWDTFQCVPVGVAC
jgi:hypothetical protein